MQNVQEQLDDLKQIRSLMEKSSKFIGLSGLSGVSAGVCAIIGAAITYNYLGIRPFEYEHASNLYFEKARDADKWGLNYQAFFIGMATIIVIVAISLGIYFTTRHAKKKGQSIWDATARRLLLSLAVPLGAGGIICLAFLYHGSIEYMAPCTLVFYGLALINGSKFTFPEVYYLGIIEIVLGIVAMFLLAYGLEFWVLGFGILHIIYGTMMYSKYEKGK
jgi:hypothetical protein